MTSKLDNYYLSKEEPLRSCLLALRDVIAGHDPQITKEWKFSFPFFYYRGKMLCYTRIDKKSGQPYIGFMDGILISHPALIQENRTKIKVLPIDPGADLPIQHIRDILTQAIAIHNK
ncbi:DUF1801 domain-containing protein [Pedobacter sp. KR3-3]|uniref:DUF1801 domain-containing protein n=1 Tax=Pedobacter albus TaxID=3113905 RepID=A0ABU7I439_9SPHI|nr:DUF1801 domain-containing protein [Pedobacter sp. KR3-3]MEE1944019.1 DUF1801 domain-containing protein [Pedobacter sp. KR3-3]